MTKRDITFKDYNGVERTETFYFGLNKAEIAKLELGFPGGWTNHMKKVLEKLDVPEIIENLETVILMAYGEKSDDGREFIKTKESAERFKCTEAYTNLFIELLTVEGAAKTFIEGIAPSNL